MKKILVLSVCAFLLISCSKDEGEENGKYLTEIKITEDIYKYGKPSREDTYENYIYNANGNLTTMITNYYYSTMGGRVPIYTYYKYDNKSRKIEEKTNNKRVEYLYNEIDSISERKIYNEYGLNETYTYTYNEKKQLIREDYNEITLRRKNHTLYTYTNKVLIQKDEYDENNTRKYTYKYEYDNKDNLTKRTFVKENGNSGTDFLASYKYNEDNTIAQKGTSGPDGKEITIIYTYSYNENKSIKSIHIMYNDSQEERDRKYYYIYQ